MSDSSHNKLLHHIGTGFGFLFLIGYYLLMEQTGFSDWVIGFFPAGYEGAGLMLAIIISMTPGFFIWKHYNRWMEKKLGVKGKYIEDEYYKQQEQDKQKNDH